MGPTTSGRRASKPGFLRPVAPTSALPPRPFGLNGFGNLNFPLGGFGVGVFPEPVVTLAGLDGLNPLGKSNGLLTPGLVFDPPGTNGFFEVGFTGGNGLGFELGFGVGFGVGLGVGLG